MVGGRFIRSCNDVVDLSSHNDRHTEKGAGWDGCIFGSGKRSRNILLPTPWLCVFFSLIVDCLSISRIFYCTQKPVGDACMSVYHDDRPSFWADNDVGHKLKSREREGVADWSPPTITKEKSIWRCSSSEGSNTTLVVLVYTLFTTTTTSDCTFFFRFLCVSLE